MVNSGSFAVLGSKYRYCFKNLDFGGVRNFRTVLMIALFLD